MIEFTTTRGAIRVELRRDAAPVTTRFIIDAVRAGAYDGTSFYRSDFVVQGGLHGTKNDYGKKLPVNETQSGVRLSNVRGTCSVAHFDVPDNGSTEWFVNLGDNAHLDEAYGGYCVFGVVDDATMPVVDRIAADIKASNVPVSIVRARTL